MNDFGVVIIEGNIGVGKSTLTAELANALNGMPIFEPNETNNPFLPLYYADPKRWSYTMQTHLLSNRYRAHVYAQSKVLYERSGWVVMDRSYWGDACFARVQKKDGFFTDAEFESYFKLHKDMQTHILYPTAAVFLKCSPSVCKDRISKRMSEKEGRKCESSIDLDYLKSLDDEIETLRRELKSHGVPVFVYDWNAEKTEEQIERAAENIANAIRKNLPPQHEAWTGIGGFGL